MMYYIRVMFSQKTRRHIRARKKYAVLSIISLLFIVVTIANMINSYKNTEYDRGLVRSSDNRETDTRVLKKYEEMEDDAMNLNYQDSQNFVRFNVSELPLFSGSLAEHYKAKNEKVIGDIVHGGGKFLIYKCTVRCGGLGDRLRGIANTYILALITGRRFAISHPTPCPLHNFLIPHKYNWVVDKTLILKKPFKTFNLLSKFDLPSKNMTKYFEEDVIYLKSNTDLTFQLRQQVDVPEKIPWLASLTTADIYRLVFNHLFKLHPLLREELKKFRLNYVKNNTTVCAHYRVGKNPNMINDPERYVGNISELWKFFDKYDSNGKVIYLATDSEELKVAAKEKFPKRVIDIPGKIIHTEKNEDDSECSGFKKAVLEHAWLIQCDILLLTDSGFGRTAGFWRANSKNLFCLQITGVLMCSRNTLPDVLPGSYSPLAWKSDLDTSHN